MKFHKYSDIFPILVGDGYQALKEDIHKNGQIEPIVIFNDEIIDGRNRYVVCLDLGIEPQFIKYDGIEENLLSFIVSKNLIRRHLDSDQRACIATEILPKLKEEAKIRQRKAGENFGENHPQELDKNFCEPLETGKATEKAAELLQTNTQYVDQAKYLKENKPQLFQDVKSGKVKLYKAYKEAKKPQFNHPQFDKQKLIDFGYASLALDLVKDAIRVHDNDWLLDDGQAYLEAIKISNGGLFISNWIREGARTMEDILCGCLDAEFNRNWSMD